MSWKDRISMKYFRRYAKKYRQSIIKLFLAIRDTFYELFCLMWATLKLTLTVFGRGLEVLIRDFTNLVTATFRFIADVIKWPFERIFAPFLRFLANKVEKFIPIVEQRDLLAVGCFLTLLVLMCVVLWAASPLLADAVQTIRNFSATQELRMEAEATAAATVFQGTAIAWATNATATSTTAGVTEIGLATPTPTKSPNSSGQETQTNNVVSSSGTIGERLIGFFDWLLRRVVVLGGMGAAMLIIIGIGAERTENDILFVAALVLVAIWGIFAIWSILLGDPWRLLFGS